MWFALAFQVNGKSRPASLALNIPPGRAENLTPAKASDLEERGILTFVPAPSDLPTMRWDSGEVNLSAALQLLLGALVPPGTAAGQPALLGLV